MTAEIERRGLTPTDQAEWLIPRGVSASERKRLLNAARVKVTRFLKGVNGDPPIRTSEMVAVYCEKLAIPPFEFTAGTREEAAAMEAAQRDPSTLARVMAAGSLVVALESGEHRLDELISRQTDNASSVDGAVGRRSRAGVAGSRAAGGVRR